MRKRREDQAVPFLPERKAVVGFVCYEVHGTDDYGRRYLRFHVVSGQESVICLWFLSSASRPGSLQNGGRYFVEGELRYLGDRPVVLVRGFAAVDAKVRNRGLNDWPDQAL